MYVCVSVGVWVRRCIHNDKKKTSQRNYKMLLSNAVSFFEAPHVLYKQNTLQQWLRISFALHFTQLQRKNQ